MVWLTRPPVPLREKETQTLFQTVLDGEVKQKSLAMHRYVIQVIPQWKLFNLVQAIL